ncbi:MAG: hypothetical protein FWG64_01605, partial [Firmicutes bacterium]|nr:hypothetical protein [Bacillota bacterium]
TKQDTNFEQAVNATRLFADVLGKNINLEKYFAENHAKYGVTTDCNNNYCNQWQLYCIIMIRYYERSEIYETRKPICWHRWH